MTLKTFNMPTGGLVLDDGSVITGKFQLDTAWFNSDGTIKAESFDKKGNVVAGYSDTNMFNANNELAEMNLSVSTPTGTLSKFGQVDFTSSTTQSSRVADQNSATVDKTTLDNGEMTLSYNSASKVYTVSFFDDSGTNTNDRQLSFSFTGNPSTTSTLNMTTSTFVKYESNAAQDAFLVNASNVICYSKGTYITTEKGDVLVEDLVAGDMALTVSGQYAPVKWLGRRTINCKTHPNPTDAWPVCIKQGAFGDQLPKRDLYLSPLHSIYVNGHFIPAIDLVNGSNIIQEQFAEVTYFHVELPSHNVIFAEGLPAESYLDDNNRNFFVGSDNSSVTDLHSEFSEKASSEEIWAQQGFAKVMRAGSPEVDVVKAMLLEEHSKKNISFQVAA